MEGITEATKLIDSIERGSVSLASFSDFTGSDFCHWLDNQLITDPEQSDVVHDLLAIMAERMVEMNNEKRLEIRGFLDWLADYTGLHIDEWKLKTYVQAYWEHPWSELQRALRQNRTKMMRDVEGREAHEKIKGEYENSIEKLQPLMTRINASDRLIDLIVYRLYELTKADVELLEGK